MIDTRLAKQEVGRRSGAERFHASSRPMPEQLLGFWQWSASDLLENTTRGILAEYLVALDLGLAAGARGGWDAYDLITAGGIKIEVKSSARFQAWHQKKPYAIQFNIGATYATDEETGEQEAEQRRQADIYIFCVLDHTEQPLDPLDVDHWQFYVLPARDLPAGKTMRLTTLLRLEPVKARFGEIGVAIDRLTTDPR